jgi:hypothetical protein
MTSDTTRDLVRRSLHDHLDPVAAEGDLVAGVRAVAASRRRTRRVLLAVAAVVAVVGSTAAVVVVHERPADRASDGGVGRGHVHSAGSSIDTSRWRLESYRGVELRVPRSWGWGASPRSLAAQCGPYFARRTDAFQQALSDVGYVGRPDAKAGWQPCPTAAVLPHTPYVWFDSPEPVGTTTVSSGARLIMLRTTVKVDGVRVTVADNDAAERSAILETVAAAPVDGNGCPMSAAVATAMEVAPPRLGGTAAFSVSEIGPAQRVAVCLFASTGRRPLDTLVASDQLSGAAAGSAQLAFVASPTTSAVPLVYCSGLSVMLIFQGEQQRALAQASLTPPCRTWVASGGLPHPVTRANVAPWLVGSVRSYLVGNGTGRLVRSFAR